MHSQLPIHEVAAEIATALNTHGRAVISAPPGAGKSTELPLLLSEATGGKKILLAQPRRVAARSIAARLSDRVGSPMGQRIGYQVRQDRRWGKSTEVVVMTYGVLLRRLQSDPCLDAFGLVLLDEFHERSLDSDLSLGLLWQLHRALRPDLRIGVMSATLDVSFIAEYLSNAPKIVSRGQQHEVTIQYSDRMDRGPITETVAATIVRACREASGNILAFLPGVGEIKQTQRALERLRLPKQIDIMQLFGEMSPQRQDAVLAPSAKRKIILATNVAETSVTIDGVACVVDSGQARILRIDSSRGLPKLEIEPISQAAAEQRAGRAGRQQPGLCYRLWPSASHRARPPFETPEVQRGDLSHAILQLASLGETNPLAFPWLTPPSPDAVETAQLLLNRLGALRESKLTSLGAAILKLPTHPRLARLILAGNQFGIGRLATACAALLSEKEPFLDGGSKRIANDRLELLGLRYADLLDRSERFVNWIDGAEEPALNRGLAANSRRTFEHLWETASRVDMTEVLDEDAGVGGEFTNQQKLAFALLTGFPDRLTKRRTKGSDRGIMVGGTGVRIRDESLPGDANVFLAIESISRGGDPAVKRAVAIDPDWLPETEIEEKSEAFFHPSQKSIVGRKRRYWFDLMLSESPEEVRDATLAGEMLSDQLTAHWHLAYPNEDETLQQWISRVNYVHRLAVVDEFPLIDQAWLVEVGQEICRGKQSFAQVKQAPWLDYLKARIGFESSRMIDELAPASVTLPSERDVPIDYATGETPCVRVRLQELFGWPSSPLIGGGRERLLIRILAPNQREIQVTQDLENFWKVTYSGVRKELRRRYPKHQWPEDPSEGQPSKSGLQAHRRKKR